MLVLLAFQVLLQFLVLRVLLLHQVLQVLQVLQRHKAFVQSERAKRHCESSAFCFVDRDIHDGAIVGIGQNTCLEANLSNKDNESDGGHAPHQSTAYPIHFKRMSSNAIAMILMG